MRHVKTGLRDIEIRKLNVTYKQKSVAKAGKGLKTHGISVTVTRASSEKSSQLGPLTTMTEIVRPVFVWHGYCINTFPHWNMQPLSLQKYKADTSNLFLLQNQHKKPFMNGVLKQ